MLKTLYKVSITSLAFFLAIASFSSSSFASSKYNLIRSRSGFSVKTVGTYSSSKKCSEARKNYVKKNDGFSYVCLKSYSKNGGEHLQDSYEKSMWSYRVNRVGSEMHVSFRSQPVLRTIRHHTSSLYYPYMDTQIRAGDVVVVRRGQWLSIRKNGQWMPMRDADNR